MSKLTRLVGFSLIVLMAWASSQNANATEYAYDTAGCGYEQCRQAPCLTPAIALGAIALVAIIAVAVQNSSHHGHGHCHSGS